MERLAMIANQDAGSGRAVARPVPHLRAEHAAVGVIPRVREVVLAQPDAVAVADEQQTLTFADLAGLAAAGLAALRAADLPPGAPVAVLHQHRPAAVAAVLAVIASGHPLLVLDPRTPAARLRQFVERAGAAACVADRDGAAVAADLVPRTVLLPDTPADPGTLWAAPPDPAAPAVLAFTSGSTGRPKGVINDHRMLVRDAWANSHDTGCYGPDDVVAHTLPMAFHAGLMVTVAGVLVGTTLRLYDVRSHGIGGLADWVGENGATVMHCSPAILRAFVGARPDPAALTGLRSLTIAGEAAHGRDVEAARALLPRTCTVRNRYGSSETGLIAEYPVPGDHPPLDGALPVGRPVGGLVLDLVDTVTGDDGRPAGVLTVSGPYLASGYWGDDGATAAAFHRHDDGRITYRTSDVGSFDPTGTLRLLGRRDHSVKIRGYLVEPAEVDAALFALPDVAEALTIGAPRPGSDRMRLVAYVVSTAERPAAAEIRARLRETLPAYMVPETVVFLDALPRTDRGKLDRSALPEPPAVVTGKGGQLSEWENAIAALWSRVLSLEEIGREDDFFELGGDSLAAEQLMSLLVSDLGVPVDEATTSVLIQAPTIAQFAARLRRRPDQGPGVLVPLQPQGEQLPMFMVAGGGGLGVAFVPLARLLGEDQPSWALQAKALEKRGLPDWSVRSIARRHVQAMRGVQPFGPYHLAGHSFGGIVALEMAHQLRAAGQDVDLLVLLDSFPPDPSLYPSPLEGSLTQRLRGAAALAATGVLWTPGREQYWRFHRQSMLLGKLYRGAPWDGRTLVVIADSPEKEARSAWGPHLTGEWRAMHVSADHISMMREPSVSQIAAAIQEELVVVRGRRPGGGRSGVPGGQQVPIGQQVPDPVAVLPSPGTPPRGFPTPTATHDHPVGHHDPADQDAPTLPATEPV